MNRRNKNITIFFLLFFTLVPILFITSPIWQSPFVDSPDIYVTDGDIIRNFRLQEYKGLITDSSGNVRPYYITPPIQENTVEGEGGYVDKGIASDFYSNRMRIEQGGVWQVRENGSELLAEETIEEVINGEKIMVTYLFYKLQMFNRFNVYTNVLLGQTSPLNKQSTNLEVMNYKEYNIFNVEYTKRRDSAYMRHSYYEFGDIRTFNQKHIFQGTAFFTFDIDPSPFVSSIIGNDGDEYKKEFDYITISSALISQSEQGLMSDATPTVNEFLPQESRTIISEEEKGFGGSTSGDKCKSWNARPSLSPSTPAESFDGGLVAPSKGSSMKPTLKDGSDIWNPQSDLRSQEDARIELDIPRISPTIVEYKSTLSYKHTKIRDRREQVGGECEKDTEQRSRTRSSALQINNRYFSVEVEITFNVYSAYRLVAVNSGLEGEELDKPKEYYDNLIFSTIVDGVSGGERITIQELSPIEQLAISILVFFIAIVSIVIITRIIKRQQEISKTKAERRGSGGLFESLKSLFSEGKKKK